MEEEGQREVAHAVLVEYADCFPARLGAGDPPTDVPPTKVQLRPSVSPIAARARRVAPGKTRSSQIAFKCLVSAGVVVVMLGSLFVSPAMAVVIPSSVKANVQAACLVAWDLPDIMCTKLKATGYYLK